jgi:hypothetical protein
VIPCSSHLSLGWLGYAVGMWIAGTWNVAQRVI